MLPYLSPDPKTGIAPFDCRTCRDETSPVGYMPPEVRSSWHCGYMPEEEWTSPSLDAQSFDGGFAMPDGSACNLCPGWIVAFPQVREAQEATWALRNQVLREYFPEPTALQLDAAREMDAAYKLLEARRLATPGS